MNLNVLRLIDQNSNRKMHFRFAQLSVEKDCWSKEKMPTSWHQLLQPNDPFFNCFDYFLYKKKQTVYKLGKLITHKVIEFGLQPITKQFFLTHLIATIWSQMPLFPKKFFHVF